MRHVKIEDGYAALCAWEHVLSNLEQSTISAINERIGMCEFRNEMIRVGHMLNVAYDSLNGTYEEAFDWDFVPDVLSKLGNFLEAPQDAYNAAALSCATKKG